MATLISVDSDQYLLKENEYQSLLSKLSVELYDVTVKIDTENIFI